MPPVTKDLPEDTEAPKAKAEPSDAADQTAVHALVHGWVYDHLANSPVSRDEKVWATVMNALPALEAAILKKG